MNPTIIEIPHETVTKVAESINYIDLLKMEGSKKYYKTYRNFEELPPDPPVNLDNPRVPVTGEWVEMPDYITTFKSSSVSDVYVYCTNGDPEESGYLNTGVFTGFDMSQAGGYTEDFELAVSKGLIPGHSIIDKFGVNDVITPISDPEDVVETGGIYPEDEFGTAPIISIASTSALDVGVQVKMLYGLDINGDRIYDTYTLNGLNRVALTTPLWKSLSAEIVGTQEPEGDIFIYTGTGAVPSLGDPEVRTYLSSIDRRTNIGYVTIPNKKVGFLYRGELGMELDSPPSSGGEYARCRYISKRVDSVFTTKKNISLVSNGVSIYSDKRPFPDPIPGLTSLKLNVKEVSVTMGVWGTAIILLVDESLFPDSYLENIGQPGY